ncbi:MAG: AAA family ATPase [Coriobacteriia bacterium]|nr:AAA family ATPase [Coriobacteriia bacterium]
MDDETLFPRFALRAAETALCDTPVVVIQGARQVGKSTLTQMIAATRDARVVTMDDHLTLDLATDDPKAVICQYPDGLLAIDEAQRAPELILPLKAHVDASRRPGRFLLTGSVDLLRVKGVGDSLAGRAETVEMLPFSQGELARRETPEDFVTWLLHGAQGGDFSALDAEAVIRGGFPEACKRSESRARSWMSSYVARLSDHDARELKGGGYADRLAAVLTYIASLGRAELVKARLARHLGLAESTVDIYWRLAKSMHLVHESRAWGRAPHRRLVLRPKVCLLDTGLSAALVGFTSAQAATPGGREYYGALIKQFVVMELAKQRTWAEMPYDLHHFRALDGLEIDLLAEVGDGSLIAVEVKSTQTPVAKHWKSLVALKDRLPDRDVTGVLLHTGDAVAHLHDWLHILPVTSLWQHGAC